MKLLITLSATASLLVLASAMTNIATADGIQIGDAGNAAPANIPDTNGVDIHATQPDTGITVPPPGSFCSECNAWENDCKARCGGGRLCENFCRCERAKRKGCRYTGCGGKKPGDCPSKPRSVVQRQFINGIPGHWKEFGFGV